MKKVLIICTGNSCRSIMAEALINHYLNQEWQTFSAGTHPSHVHPYAIKALQELGIATHYLSSQSISEYWHCEDLDLLITVCDHAKDNCPAFFKAVKRVHLSFADPVSYLATDLEAAMRGFRAVRDAMIKDLLPLLKANHA